jgi:hypothetical protein
MFIKIISHVAKSNHHLLIESVSSASVSPKNRRVLLEPFESDTFFMLDDLDLVMEDLRSIVDTSDVSYENKKQTPIVQDR